MCGKSVCLAPLVLLILPGLAPAQLLIHYQFDETTGLVAVDTSGKGNEGTLRAVDAAATTVDANWVAAGWLDGALSFNGTFGVVLPAENLGLRSDAGTVAFWMNKPSLAGAINTIWWGGDNTTGGGFGPENEMHIHTEAVGAGIWMGGELSFHGQNNPNFHLHSDPNKGEAGNAPQAPILMADGQWHHVAATWGNEDGNVKLYLDGVLLHELAYGDRSYALNHMYLGQMANGSRTYNGLLDEVQIYGRALTADEVQSLVQGVLALSYQASLPDPADEITEVPRDAVLRWMTGDTARTHNVYFGTNAEDVNEATPADPRGVLVSPNQTDAAYDPPGLLDYDQTYFWRVDEVEADGATVHRGEVWSFTAVNFIVVDDFERYRGEEPDRLFDAWLDGWGTENNGAVVGHAKPPYVEQTILHQGNQSMPLYYDTDFKYSETVRTLEGPAGDWTADGVQELALWFRGYPAYLGGFAEEPAGTYTIHGAGTDIWGAADEFHFAFKELTGAVTITARVESVTATNEYAKAGVMVRDTLDPNSRNAAVFVTPMQGVRFQYRNTVAAATVSEFAAGLTAPYWVKVERTAGGLIRAYHSPDGATWTRFSLQSVGMTMPVYVGLAVTSHAPNVVCAGVFSHVTITGAGSDTPWIDQDVGIRGNRAERIYVALNDTVVYHEDPNATLAETWTEWRIPLQEFAEQGVNLSGVSQIAVGVGTKDDAAAPGGPGLLYLDDIRLYRP